MSDAPREKPGKEPEKFPGTVGRKEDRKLRARREEKKKVWFGLGMFGLVGWSVAIPAVVCTAIGVWIDSRYPGRYSWTLMLLIIGMGLGCLNAWFWVKKESEGG